MVKRLTLALVAALALSVGPAGVPAALAGDTPCTAATPLFGGTYANVVVPAGEICVMVGATVQGNVKAGAGATLISTQNTITGDVQTDTAATVFTGGDAIGGNLQITGGTGSTQVCADTFARGNIEIQKRLGGPLSVGNGDSCPGNVLGNGNLTVQQSAVSLGPLDVRGNSVHGNLQVNANTGPAAKTVQGNTVGNNLQCAANTDPFVGGPNTAGKAAGQCF
jgi:hypothetical protein